MYTLQFIYAHGPDGGQSMPLSAAAAAERVSELTGADASEVAASIAQLFPLVPSVTIPTARLDEALRVTLIV